MGRARSRLLEEPGRVGEADAGASAEVEAFLELAQDVRQRLGRRGCGEGSTDGANLRSGPFVDPRDDHPSEVRPRLREHQEQLGPTVLEDDVLGSDSPQHDLLQAGHPVLEVGGEDAERDVQPDQQQGKRPAVLIGDRQLLLDPGAALRGVEHPARREGGEVERHRCRFLLLHHRRGRSDLAPADGELAGEDGRQQHRGEGEVGKRPAQPGLQQPLAEPEQDDGCGGADRIEGSPHSGTAWEPHSSPWWGRVARTPRPSGARAAATAPPRSESPAWLMRYQATPPSSRSRRTSRTPSTSRIRARICFSTEKRAMGWTARSSEPASAAGRVATGRGGGSGTGSGAGSGVGWGSGTVSGAGSGSGSGAGSGSGTVCGTGSGSTGAGGAAGAGGRTTSVSSWSQPATRSSSPAHSGRVPAGG